MGETIASQICRSTVISVVENKSTEHLRYYNHQKVVSHEHKLEKWVTKQRLSDLIKQRRNVRCVFVIFIILLLQTLCFLIRENPNRAHQLMF